MLSFEQVLWLNRSNADDCTTIPYQCWRIQNLLFHMIRLKILVLLIPTFSTLTSFSCIYKYLLQLSFVQNNRSLHIISLCRKRFPRKWSQKTKTLWRILTVVLLQFSKLNIFQEDRNNFACISNFFFVSFYFWVTNWGNEIFQ